MPTNSPRVAIQVSRFSTRAGRAFLWLVLCNVSTAQECTIQIQFDQRALPISRYLTGACIEDVNHEVYGGIDSQMIFGESFAEPAQPRKSKRKNTFRDGDRLTDDDEISGPWRALRRGNAIGKYSLHKQDPFSGTQSQSLTFAAGEGEIGMTNASLNDWGMHFVEGKPYEGYIYARSDTAISLSITLEDRDRDLVYAEQILTVSKSEWQQLKFDLTPNGSTTSGQFAVKLKQPGTVAIGYAFLQPGSWRRFRDLPTRRDVAEALVAQGITVLRQGGSMVNVGEYRWKKMIGPRAGRPPYTGAWYPYSSNGWGIFDFLNLCEAAGFLGIPAINMGETPPDMADFVEYCNGPADSTWGRKRVADGHPTPYRLKYLQLGNEEDVDENYWRKFEPIANEIWAKDAEIILIVGDFAYSQPIPDPFHVSGALSGITSLAAHQKILQLANGLGREVWFDVHIRTDGPQPDWGGTMSYLNALERIAEGAKHRVVIFELNANNHSQQRALANALAIHAVQRDGRIPMVTSANCLQPDGENDNAWNQGLLFLNPTSVWLQPPGYVTQMISQSHLPLLVTSTVEGTESGLDVVAKRSEDGQQLVLQVVNSSVREQSATIHMHGYAPSQSVVHVEQLAGPLEAVNTAENPTNMTPRKSTCLHDNAIGQTHHSFPPYSFSVLTYR